MTIELKNLGNHDCPLPQQAPFKEYAKKYILEDASWLYVCNTCGSRWSLILNTSKSGHNTTYTIEAIRETGSLPNWSKPIEKDIKRDLTNKARNEKQEYDDLSDFERNRKHWYF